MQNNNTSISQDLNRIFDLKGECTSLIADFIQPVVRVIPKLDIVRSVQHTATGSLAVYITPAGKDFYLVGYTHGHNTDVTSDLTSSTITATIDGAAQTISRINKLSLVVNDSTVSHSFAYPVKIDRGTTIFLNGTFAANNCVKYATIYGYTVETTK